MIKLAVVENMTKVAKAGKPMLIGMNISSLYMHDLSDHEQEEQFKDNIRSIHIGIRNFVYERFKGIRRYIVALPAK